MSTLVDFEDIYRAILGKIKIPTTDGVTLTRIKDDINMVYLDEVLPYKARAWYWAQIKENISTYEKFATGTVTATEDSTTITFDAAVADSLAGHYIKLTGYPDIIKIASHTAATDTATLEEAWINTTVTDGGFKAWRDNNPLSEDTREVLQVMQSRLGRPLTPLTTTKFEEIRGRQPELEGIPTYFTVDDFNASGERVLRWYPACHSTRMYLNVEGRVRVDALSADGDEPIIPIEDRIVLYYGGVALAWERERNETEATKNWNLFYKKLDQMAARAGHAPVVTEMRTDPDYLVRKRYRRWVKRGHGRRFESE
jgi:hypothetical protein